MEEGKAKGGIEGEFILIHSLTVHLVLEKWYVQIVENTRTMVFNSLMAFVWLVIPFHGDRIYSSLKLL